MSRVTLIHHINIQISDREKTREWYENVLGAEYLDRGPTLNKGQLQLKLGNAEIHTNDTPNPVTVPAEENIQIECGGALVRPGDVIVGDEDGVVVVPSWFAKECLEITKEHEDAEAWVKEKTVAENTIPGKYYGNNLMENYRNRDK